MEETDGCPRLDVRADRLDGAIVLRVAGEIDMATEVQLRELLRWPFDRGEPGTLLVVDMAEVRFCGVRGLGILLDAADAIRDAGGAMVVVQSPPALTRLAELLEIGPALPVLDDLGAALLWSGAPSRPDAVTPR